MVNGLLITLGCFALLLLFDTKRKDRHFKIKILNWVEFEMTAVSERLVVVALMVLVVIVWVLRNVVV